MKEGGYFSVPFSRQYCKITDKTKKIMLKLYWKVSVAQCHERCWLFPISFFVKFYNLKQRKTTCGGYKEHSKNPRTMPKHKGSSVKFNSGMLVLQEKPDN